MQELTTKNERLVLLCDEANSQIAELSARFETGGLGPSADARASKIVEVSKKNRELTLRVEVERAEKKRAQTQLALANAQVEILAQNKTESEVEKACREIVETAAIATESAQIECAAVTEKWKLAETRATRFSGQKATLKTENERLKRTIVREIGEHCDFGRLDDFIALTGGKEGRAKTIRELRHKVGYLKVQLAEANDAVALVANGVDDLNLSGNVKLHGIPTLYAETLGDTWKEQVFPDDAGSSVRTEHQTLNVFANAEDAGGGNHDSRALTVTAARLDVTHARVDELAAELDDTRQELSESLDLVTHLSKSNRNLETEVQSLLEKVTVLKDKSDHDEKLVTALRDETHRLALASASSSVFVTDSEFGELGAFGKSELGYDRVSAERAPTAGGNHNSNSVPLAAYALLEKKTAATNRTLQKTEREILQMRARNASLEHALERALLDGGYDAESELGSQFAPAAIAAAAIGDRVPNDERDDVGKDVANLMAHSERLEGVLQEMKSKLVLAENTVEQLRTQVREERGKYADAVGRAERLGGATGSETGTGGTADVGALRVALLEQKAETQRVRQQYQTKLEGMEKEVELYAEMMTELKKEAAANRTRGASPKPKTRTGLPG